jgi:hypothetical protein
MVLPHGRIRESGFRFEFTKLVSPHKIMGIDPLHESPIPPPQSEEGGSARDPFIEPGDPESVESES